MKYLIWSSVLIFSTTFCACENDNIPSYPRSDVIVGQWGGTISFYFSEYPLTLSIEQVRNDSITGQMIIDYDDLPDTVMISTALVFQSDSLAFDLNVGARRMCTYDWMDGNLVTVDSIAGHWNYRCINDPGFVSSWAVHRVR